MPEHTACMARFLPVFRSGGNIMLDRTEALSLFAMIAFMALVATGIAYEGALLQGPQRTAQLAVPTMEP